MVNHAFSLSLNIQMTVQTQATAAQVKELPHEGPVSGITVFLLVWIGQVTFSPDFL
jgi:hypothetical protein